jgi:hypothetical protein
MKISRISSNGAARHLPKAHAGLRKLRPHVRAALATARTGKVCFDVGEPDIIGPAVSVGLDVMATAVIAAIDQRVGRIYSALSQNGAFDPQRTLVRSSHCPRREIDI